MYPMILRFISALRSILGFSGKPVDTVAEVIQEPELPGWKTETIPVSSFVKVGRIAMCSDGLAIYSDVDDRGFILLNGDIDAVLDGEKRDGQVACQEPAGRRQGPGFCIGKGIEYFNRCELLHGSFEVGAGGAGRQEQESGVVRGEIVW